MFLSIEAIEAGDNSPVMVTYDDVNKNVCLPSLEWAIDYLVTTTDEIPLKDTEMVQALYDVDESTMTDEFNMI